MARKKNSGERTHLFCLWAVLAMGKDGWTADDCGRGRLRARAGTRAWADEAGHLSLAGPHGPWAMSTLCDYVRMYLRVFPGFASRPLPARP